MAGYVDLDYARDLDKYRSITGYPQALKSWMTLQSTIALSTTRVEYMVVLEALKEAIRFLGLLGDLRVMQKHSNVYSDIKRAIHAAKNQVYQTKYIDVKFYFELGIIEEMKYYFRRLKLLIISLI